MVLRDTPSQGSSPRHEELVVTRPDTKREDLALLSDEPSWSCNGTVCRRVMFLVGDVGVVVFVSDANSHGGSIANRMEELARVSRREVTFKAPG